MPGEIRVDLYIKGPRLPPERAAGAPNGVGNVFDRVGLQAQLAINQPDAAVAGGPGGDPGGGNAREQGGRGQRLEGQQQNPR